MEAATYVIDHNDMVIHMRTVGLRFTINKPQFWGVNFNSYTIDDVTAHVDLNNLPKNPPAPGKSTQGLPEYWYTVSLEMVMLKPNYQMPKPQINDAATQTPGLRDQYPAEILDKLALAHRVMGLTEVTDISDALKLVQVLIQQAKSLKRPRVEWDDTVDSTITPQRPPPDQHPATPTKIRPRSPLFTKSYMERQNFPDNVAEYGSDDDTSQQEVLRHKVKSRSTTSRRNDKNRGQERRNDNRTKAVKTNGHSGANHNNSARRANVNNSNTRRTLSGNAGRPRR
jgi:hypothetical protein